jgi:signal transduction histidine kinase
MSNIVEDLLLLSKADSGEIHLRKEEIHLEELAKDVLAQASILARAKEIDLHLSSRDGEIRIVADPLRIRELLLNLIENGIKYTPPHGSVSILLERIAPPLLPDQRAENSKGLAAGFAQMVVSDTGIGIAKEDQKRIFDRFFRVDKARSRSEGGSGLGLSICKWIVEAHQGEISVESEIGQGSRFTVKLPLSFP